RVAAARRKPRERSTPVRRRDARAPPPTTCPPSPRYRRRGPVAPERPRARAPILPHRPSRPVPSRNRTRSSLRPNTRGREPSPVFHLPNCECPAYRTTPRELNRGDEGRPKRGPKPCSRPSVRSVARMPRRESVIKERRERTESDQTTFFERSYEQFL